MKKIRKQTAPALMFFVVILLGILRTGLRESVQFITDYQWFEKNGYLETFFVELLTKIKILLPLWIVATIAIFYYLIGLKKKYCRHGGIFLSKKENLWIKRMIGVVSLGLAFYFASSISGDIWLKTLLFFRGGGFTQFDPIFHKNLSFYFFQLPFFKQILFSSIVITGWMILVTLLFYLVAFQMKKPREGSLFDMNEIAGRPNLSSVFRKDLVLTAIRKIAVLSAIIFLLISATYFIRGYDLMYSQRGAAYGASYTDIHVTLLGYRISAFVALLSAGLVAFGLLKNKKKVAFFGPVALVLVMAASAGIGFIIQQLVVEPDEISKESVYLKHSINYTQEAFGLKTVDVQDFPAKQKLDHEVILRNKETVGNIRVNDERPLKQTFNQIQGIRLYYEFEDIDVDRYNIDGELRQVFISPRELNFEKLEEDRKTWLNRHLRFTHGYGIVMAPVNDVTPEGQPKLIFENIPPLTNTSLFLKRPELYFGEKTNDYIVVNTDEDEFDYPSGSDNAYTKYTGDAGVKLSGLNKLLYAYRMKSMKMLFSSALKKDSRIVFYRNIHERVRRIAPFLDYDRNPYLVLNEEDGKLYWIVDGYTSSDNNPYSKPFVFNGKNVNYLRNSVKVVIDAYEGTTTFYAFSKNDPLVNAYGKIFTDLFVPAEKMPDGLKKHIRYPQDYFELQSEVYRTFHVDNPVVFYNGEDIWDIGKEKYMGNQEKIQPNYVMFKMPNESRAEFALILPFTPKEKANMTALFVARNDGDEYGKLFLYKFPKNRTIQGPMMIESRIDQNSTISPQFTLWGQEGSQVLRGNVIVVPIEDGLLYVEPVYLQADNPNSLPEMKRVIVAYDDQIVMETSLDLALKKIFYKEEEPKTDEPVVPSVEQENLEDPKVQELLDEIDELFKTSEENMEKLKGRIQELNKILKEKNQSSPQIQGTDLKKDGSK